MRFWRKFAFLAMLIVVFSLLQLYSKNIGSIELSIFGKEFSVGLYITLVAVLALWLSWFTLKAFFSGVLSLFSRNKVAEDEKSVKDIAELIVSNDYDFAKQFQRLTVSDRMMPLKVAIGLRRNFFKEKIPSNTGIPGVDIYIQRLRLCELIDRQEVSKLIPLANNVIRDYPNLLHIVKDEILKVGVIARQNNIQLNFDPRKFKFNLPNSFVDKYLISTSLVDFESEKDADKKLRLIEKIQKTYSSNADVLKVFLDTIFSGDPLKIDEKKVLSAIKNVLMHAANRSIANYLLKLNKSNVFEIAQELMAGIKDDNLEKLWSLLIIATKMNFLPKAKELIRKLIHIDGTGDLIKFFVENYETLSKDLEIVKIICGKNEK